jgi:glycosyltransferase involved in cell wall biosynthesis
MSLQLASTMFDVSVIICTHNPRSDYFARILDGLRNQTLPLEKWELLIVDNASQLSLASNWDISWHPCARHISEPELGLTWARRRGIQEASAGLLMFVDDDNVLEETYLAEAIKIQQEWPSLGVWGSGSIRGNFEVEPPESLGELLPWLALREATTPRWANFVSSDDVVPWGAGICIRREVAIAYREYCDRSSIQITGRQGDSLLSADDREISFVCCSHGFGIGIFPELKLTHLIPKRRLSQDYFVRLVEGTYISTFLLDYKWRQIVPQSPFGLKTLLTVLKTILLYRGLEREKRFAWVRALATAKRIIEGDLRKRNHQIPDMATCTPSQSAVGADRVTASQSVHPS